MPKEKVKTRPRSYPRIHERRKKFKFWRPPFFIGAEEQLFELIRQFVDRVMATVDNLDRAAQALVKKKKPELRDFVANVSENEKTADDIRRMIEKRLYEGRFFDKGEKIELLEKLDDVADYAEIAAQIMEYAEFAPPKAIGDLICEMTDKTRKVAAALRNAVLQLYTDFSKVAQYAQTVEAERDGARETYGKLIKEIYSAKLPVAQLMLLRDLTFRIARTADMAEEAADRVSFLAVRYA